MLHSKKKGCLFLFKESVGGGLGLAYSEKNVNLWKETTHNLHITNMKIFCPWHQERQNTSAQKSNGFTLYLKNHHIKKFSSSNLNFIFFIQNNFLKKILQYWRKSHQNIAKVGCKNYSKILVLALPKEGEKNMPWFQVFLTVLIS